MRVIGREVDGYGWRAVLPVIATGNSELIWSIFRVFR
jgi:hypothetical protein